MPASHYVRALARVIRQQRAFDTPATFEGLDVAPASVRELLDALGKHAGVTLGQWEFGIVNGPGPKDRVDNQLTVSSWVPRDFVVEIGTRSGAEDLLLCWAAGRDESVLRADQEELTTQNEWRLGNLLEKLVAAHPDDDTVVAMRTGEPELPELPTTPSDRSITHPDPPEAAELKAGGHLLYVQQGGTVVSEHKKGIRYLDANGKRKSYGCRSKKAFDPRYTAVTADGSRAYFLGPDALHWVDLPAGKPKGFIDLADTPIDAFVLTDDDRILARWEAGLTLYRHEGDALVAVDHLVHLGFGTKGGVFRAFGGRRFLVDNAGPQARSNFLGAVDGDELRLLAHLPGAWVAFPTVQSHLLDGDDEVVLRVNSASVAVSAAAAGL